MKVSIDETCIGCGVCVEICPQIFEMEEDKAKVIKQMAVKKRDVVKKQQNPVQQNQFI